MDSPHVLVTEQLASLSLRDDNVTIIDSVSLRQADERAYSQLSSAKDSRSSPANNSKFQVNHRLKEIEEADHEKNKVIKVYQTDAGRAFRKSSSPSSSHGEIGSNPTGKRTEAVDAERQFNDNDIIINNNYGRNKESIDSFSAPVQTILVESVRRSDLSQSEVQAVSPTEKDGQADDLSSSFAAAAELDPPTCRGPVGGLAVAYRIPSDYGVSAHFGAGGKRHYDYNAYSPEIAGDFFTGTSQDGGCGGNTFEQPSKFYRPVPVESEDGYDDDCLLPDLSPDLDDLLTPGDLEEFLGVHHTLDNFDDLLPILKMFAAGDDVLNPVLNPFISAQQGLLTSIPPGQQNAFVKANPTTSTPLSFPNLPLGTTKEQMQLTAGNLLPEVSTAYEPNAVKTISWDGVRLNDFVPNSMSNARPTEFQCSSFNGNDVKPSVRFPRAPPQGSPQVYGNSGMQRSPVQHNYGQMKVEVDADNKRGMTSPFLSNPAVPSRPVMNAGAGAQSGPMVEQPPLRPPYAVSRMPISTTAAPATAPAISGSPNVLSRPQCSAAQQRTEELMNERRQLAKASSVIARLTREQLVVLDPDQDTLLHLAIAKNERYLTESLISRLDRENLTDSMINLKNKQGQSPLCLATVTNQPAIVRLLVERTVDVNALIPLGAKHLNVFCNPIHFASSNGKEWIQTLGELLNSNSLKLSAFDSEGHNALHKAVSSHGQNLFCGKNCEKIDSRESIQQLIIRGIDINQPNGLNGKTALHMSLEKGNLALFLDIISFASQRIPASHILNARTGFGGDTLLHIVARSFRTPDAMMLVQYMLGCGANAQLRNNDNRLPWEVASLPQVAEILKL